MKKIKAVSPSLREKKRYLAFEIVSKDKISDIQHVIAEIRVRLSEYLGSLGSSKAGVMVLAQRYNPEKQRGLIRVGHKFLDSVRASLCFITNIGGTQVIVRSVGASGTMKKAYDKYVA